MPLLLLLWGLDLGLRRGGDRQGLLPLWKGNCEMMIYIQFWRHACQRLAAQMRTREPQDPGRAAVPL